MNVSEEVERTDFYYECIGLTCPLMVLIYRNYLSFETTCIYI